MADPFPHSNPHPTQNFTQFTEDKVATRATPCERPACTVVIQPGEPRIYFAPVKGTVQVDSEEERGRFVCSDCAKHYRKSPSTISRRATPSQSSVDLAQLRSRINESQRQGAHTPQGRVSAFSATSLGAPTPQALLESVNFIQSFYRASQLSQAQASMAPPAPLSLAPPSTGYSAAHAQYNNQRQRWADAAYKVNLQQAVSRPSGQLPARVQEQREVRIVCQLVFDCSSGKVEKTSFREGASVLYEIFPCDLTTTVKETLCAHVTSLAAGFPWNFSAMVVREVTSWQDVAKVDQDRPYFSGRFIKEKPSTAKSNGPTTSFTSPRTPIEFYLIIDRIQHLSYEEYLDDPSSFPSKHPATPPVPAQASSSKRKEPPSPEAHKTAAQLPVGTSSKKACHTNTTHSASASSSFTTSKSVPNTASNQPSVVPSAISTARSLTSALSGFALYDKSGGTAVFQRLNRDQIRQGIQLGAENAISEKKKEFDVIITERVTCFLVNTILFPDLCSGGPSHIINKNQPHLGYVTYRKDNVIGTGTFKTAIHADMNVPGLNLGVVSNNSTSIVLKRPYTTARNGQAIKRFNYKDESQKVLTECTILGWADSLLRFAYSFIDSFLADAPGCDTSSSTFSILPIPRLRFIRAAVAYAEKPLEAVSASSSSHRAAYLLEELIPEFDFIKYIHNGDAAPLLKPNEEGYETAVFLCFIQHVQYIITEEQAYLSDFQGAGNLLTDPQVMTDPLLQGEEQFKSLLFGEGNVDSAFDAFKSQHRCNKYCEFFKLVPFTVDSFEGMDE